MADPPKEEFSSLMPLLFFAKAFHYVKKKINERLTYMIGVGNLECLPCECNLRYIQHRYKRNHLTGLISKIGRVLLYLIPIHRDGSVEVLIIMLINPIRNLIFERFLTGQKTKFNNPSEI